MTASLPASEGAEPSTRPRRFRWRTSPSCLTLSDTVSTGDKAMASAARLRQVVTRGPRVEAASVRARRAALALAGARAVFQPIVSVATGSLLAVEALTRLTRAPRDLQHLFDGARSAGFGFELEALCVRSALALRDRMSADTLVAVNLSPEGLRSHASAEFWPSDLSGVIIEITEQDAPDLDEVGAALALLRERGAALAVDDVGSGYAGLLRIADLRPDFVKVDRQIVSGPADTSARTAVLDALVTFSHRLGAAVIAEGVEDVADLELLAAMDVDYAQGYAIGRPAWPPQPVGDHVVRACRAARRRVLDGSSAGLTAARTREIYAMSAALSSVVHLEDVLAAISSAAAELDVDAIGVSVIGADDALREVAATGRAVDPTPYVLTDYPATVAALRTGRSLEVQVEDPTGDVAELEVLQLFDQASLLLTPMFADREPIGVIELTSHTPRRWSSSDIAYAHGLAAHLGPVLSRSGPPLRRRPRPLPRLD